MSIYFWDDIFSTFNLQGGIREEHSEKLMRTCRVKGDLPGTPKDMGPHYGKRDPYYSHTIPISLGILMGVVWE